MSPREARLPEGSFFDGIGEKIKKSKNEHIAFLGF